MKSIYLSADDENMILYDDEKDLFTLFSRRGQQLTKSEGDAVRSEVRREQAHKRKQRLCSLCEKPGHLVTTCPQNVPRPDAESEFKPKDENTLPKPNTVSELKQRIEELKADGMTSVEIAKELHCTLTLINRYW